MISRVRPEDFAGIDGHWTVEKNRQVGNSLFLLQTIEMIQEELCAPDREGGNDDRAALGCGRGDDLRELVLRAGNRMLAIPVGRFDDEVIRFGNRIWCEHEGIVGPSEIARKHNCPAAKRESSHCGAQNVTGMSVFERKAVGEIVRDVEVK